jgi:hypothetical protein
MPNSKIPRTYQNIFQSQENPRKTKNAHENVRQDKRAETRARLASGQPAPSHIPMRAQPLRTKTPRTKNRQEHKRRTVQLTLWVSPIEKAEIQRRAERENLSLSTVGAALLRKGLQTDLDLQYGALLEPVFASLLDRRMSSRDNRLALLLVRIAFGVEQTRSLTTNILGRQPGIKPDALNTILERSAKDAKRKITRRSPELEALIQEINSYLAEDGKK